MKKLKLLVTAILFSVSVFLTGCNKNTDSASTTSETASIESSIEESNPSSETNSDLEAVGDVGVEKGLFYVELNIPAKFVGEQTQEDLNELCKEKGYKSITLNDDGSAAYLLTKQQHKQMMNEIKDNINSSITEMIGSEDYPNYTNITANENFTEFEVTTKSAELSMAESFSVLGFYMYGGMYNIFNGTAVDNVSVKFINADTGEVISTTNSKDMGE
ncbi:hypothetical protein [Clostridium sp. Marseille-P2415]|uniref:hypothetical protein n=1 Tax=Clostridium sp. Marseille-P2415 TaxID=1805471 RepID=UPI0009888519|nr:hypothetical protein [Clostridium sp. Marseille-P2415]